jgi:hypothetical protein
MRRLPIVCAVFILAAQGHRHSPLPPTTLYTCSGQSTPSADLANIGGRVSVTGTCSFTGDLILDGSGTTSISTNAATFNLAGNLVLSGATSFIVVGGVFRLASQFVFQYSISTSDRARFEMQDAELSTNDGSVAGTTTANYTGTGSSVLKFTNVTIDMNHSWLLASAFNESSIVVADSQAPVEIYPNDSATVSISGPTSKMKIWLDFTSGLSADITNLPDSSNPYTFSIGPRTPETASVSTNAQFQVDLVNASAQFGFISYPGSSLTLTSPQGPTSYSYYFLNPPSPIDINGEFVVSQDAPISTTLTDSGRTLKLVDVPLVPIAWQVYSQATSGVSQPVTITGSASDPTKSVTLNEVGAFDGGNFSLDTVTCLWSTITAVGSGSISVTNSQIASQTIAAMNTGQILITDSTIYGSLFQVRDSAVIRLINTPLLRGSDVPNPPPAGFPALAQNPSLADANAYPTFLIDPAGGAVVAATIDAFTGPLSLGSTITFRGDAFVESQVAGSCTFNLSYFAPGAATFTPITTGGACPVLARIPGNNLGSLDTTGLPAGTYTAKLEIYLNGTLAVAAPRIFTLN